VGADGLLDGRQEKGPRPAVVESRAEICPASRKWPTRSSGSSSSQSDARIEVAHRAVPTPPSELEPAWSLLERTVRVRIALLVPTRRIGARGRQRCCVDDDTGEEDRTRCLGEPTPCCHRSVSLLIVPLRGWLTLWKVQCRPAGSVIRIPPGVPHALRNQAPDSARGLGAAAWNHADFFRGRTTYLGGNPPSD
jgi:hypothetical protein